MFFNIFSKKTRFYVDGSAEDCARLKRLSEEFKSRGDVDSFNRSLEFAERYFELKSKGYTVIAANPNGEKVDFCPRIG